MPKKRQEIIEPDFAAALDEAGVKPPNSAKPGDKKNYSERLSNALARTIQPALQSRATDRVLQGSEVHAEEETVGAGEGRFKKIDVMLVPPKLGLALNISIKTQNFEDHGRPDQPRRTKFFCHNLTRVIDGELRVEARACHDRFPYAVLVGLVFLPITACFDNERERCEADDTRCTSFAEWARRLHAIQERDDPKDHRQDAKFEKCYIGVYWPADDSMGKRGDVFFFDVNTAPPQYGRPAQRLSFGDVLDATVRHTVSRNTSGIKLRGWGDSEDLPRTR